MKQFKDMSDLDIHLYLKKFDQTFNMDDTDIIRKMYYKVVTQTKRSAFETLDIIAETYLNFKETVLKEIQWTYSKKVKATN